MMLTLRLFIFRVADSKIHLDVGNAERGRAGGKSRELGWSMTEIGLKSLFIISLKIHASLVSNPCSLFSFVRGSIAMNV
jgi:hypothetical protein